MIQTLQICTNHFEKRMMNTAINLLSVIPMRKEPSHRSEMVSQLLFGEHTELLEEEGHFVKVKCLCDNYEGWVQSNQLSIVDEELTTNEFTCAYTCEVVQNGQTLRIPFGSPVYSGDTYSFTIAGNEIKYLATPNEVWNNIEHAFSGQNLWAVYRHYLNTPYLWGGKSVFGIDCSGFVQQVFKMLDKQLLRDAWLQAEQGDPVYHLSESKEGDLAFFGNENGRVIHVGIILDDNRIVHASGKVRIDRIHEEGIVNVETGNRTHQLHSIRRYF
jgi:cell wall-associated NlpC family hydrolase